MKTETGLIESDPMHATLEASGRWQAIPESADIYGLLIGSWDPRYRVFKGVDHGQFSTHENSNR